MAVMNIAVFWDVALCNLEVLTAPIMTVNEGRACSAHVKSNVGLHKTVVEQPRERDKLRNSEDNIKVRSLVNLLSSRIL
jgi:hypothetical protein